MSDQSPIKYTPINGWTKETIIEAIQTKNKGVPSMAPDVGCSYFGDGNNRCAVGCFIPDDFIERVKEWERAGHKTFGAMALVKAFPEMGLPLDGLALSQLQTVHDRIDRSRDPRPAMIRWVEENVA